MLLGLLALNASWRPFTIKNGQFGSFASSSAEEVRRQAIQICENPNNDVALALTASFRQGLGEFYFKDARSEDLTDKISANGRTADISYNGRTEITRITTEPVTRDRIERSSDVAATFGSSSASQEEAPEVKLDASGKPVTERCGISTCEVKEVPKYHVFAIRVSSQTTEGDWCDDCSNENVVESSETRYIEVKVSPNPQGMKEVCKNTFEISQRLFESSEIAMKKGIEQQLKEIAELAEREELEEARDNLIRDCRIKQGASLDDIKKYNETGLISDSYTYKGKPDEKMQCLSHNLDDIKNQNDRTAYFRAQMMSMVQTMLTSTDPLERSQGMDLLAKMRSQEFGAMTPTELSYINSAQRGAQRLNEVYRLTQMVERMRGTPSESHWQLQLDNVKLQADVEHQAMMQQMMVNPNAQDAFEDADFWHSKISGLVSTNQYNTPFTAPMGALDLSRRGARLAPGQSLMGPSFEELLGTFPAAPGYINGGVDSFQANNQNPGFVPNASLPGQETGADRMVRRSRP